MAFLKQDDVNGKRNKSDKKPQRPEQPPIKHVETVPHTSLAGIECALDNLAKQVGRFASNAASGENKLAIFTGEEGSGQYPVLIALDPCSETTQDFLAIATDFLTTSQRIAKAFERIADALSAGAPGPHKAR
jgi:hypothetical protein